MKIAKKIRTDLKKLANPKHALILSSFFKTGRGEYGYGDKFLGIKVPKLRAVSKGYAETATPKDLQVLLVSRIHEERLVALLILVYQYKTADIVQKQRLYDLYLQNTSGINNWDLVDLSAPYVIGAHIYDNKDVSSLYNLAGSEVLWQRRIAIVATWYFIRNESYTPTLKLAKILLKDQEDLMHKATGWMLREVGKRDTLVLQKFLTKYYKKMPRTMLRYAIERFPEKLRLAYLRGRI